MSNHYTEWFQEDELSLLTVDGRKIRVINFLHEKDPPLLEEWAKHLRLHYSSESETSEDSVAHSMTKADYLKTMKFPSLPMIVSGDFAEILIADYFQFVLNFNVPRTRYDRKMNPNSSPQGVDVIGFKLLAEAPSPDDQLLTCEVKASLGSPIGDKFQKAIDDSGKDFDSRLPFSLNAMKRRLKDKNDLESAQLVERFQSKVDVPYKRISSAALLCSNHVWSDDQLTSCTTSTHPNKSLFLVAIKGENLMTLANKLFEIAHATA